jgi:photosystem II stability/assembly factor-like uncharacterized protein
MDGTVGHVQDDSVWLKRATTFDAFQWGGGCMGLEEGTEPLGDLTITTKRSTRGGLVRDGVMVGAPDVASTTLTMKKLHFDRKKTDLKSCFWHVDQRTLCGGIDEDAWNEWREITRYCFGKATERTTPPVTFEGDNEEQMITFPWKALWVDDLRRVVGEIGSPLAGMTVPLAITFTDITTLQPARCGDACSDQEECVVVAVTETVALGNPYLAISLFGGELNTWTDAPIALTDFGANDATAVAGAGEFIVIVSNGNASIIYTDDLGASLVNVTTADITANGPNDVDMINQAFIVVAGDSGYVFGSYDAGRTWETLEAGNVTASNLTTVKIAPDNPQVIYAASNAADVVIKSENGGRTWYAVTATGTGGTGVFSMYIKDQNHILAGTDAGEIFESTDGGQTWTEQNEIPGLDTKANTIIEDFAGCGCDVVGLVISNVADDETFFYRNVDSGANGKWYQPTEMETATATYLMVALTCCGSNHFVAAGGITVTADMIMLLE